MKKQYPEPYKREGSRFYYFKIDKNGKRSWQSTGETSKERARQRIREYVDGLAAAGGRPSAGGETFASYASRYYVWEEGSLPTCPHAARLVAEGKVIGRQHVVESRRLVDRVLEKNRRFGDLRLEEIRRADIIDLRAAIAGQFKPRIAQRMFSAIKGILSEAAYREDIPASPASSVGPVKIETQERGAFTLQELRDLLSSRPGRMGTDPRIRAFFTLLATAGLRAGEARGLRWGSLDLEGRQASIIEAAKRDAPETGAPKWEKPRRIILPKIAAAALTEWRGLALRTDAEDLVFGNADGLLMSQTVVRKAWANIMRESGIPVAGRWLTPHSLRHTLNSILLASGCSTLAVAEYLGWSSDIGKALSKVQAGYTHVELLDLRKVADAIDRAIGEPSRDDSIRRFA